MSNDNLCAWMRESKRIDVGGLTQEELAQVRECCEELRMRSWARECEIAGKIRDCYESIG